MRSTMVSTFSLLAHAWVILFAASGTMAQDVVLPENLDVPVGYSLYRCADVLGRQIYELINGEYVLVEPSATLFRQGSEQLKEIGTFEAGPTWEFNSGKTIVAQRVLAQLTVDPNALDWLLIEGVVAPGVFEYIKQTNTVGGLPPPDSFSFSYSQSFPMDSMSMSMSFSFPQRTIEVPFSAEHCFYRRTDPCD